MRTSIAAALLLALVAPAAAHRKDAAFILKHCHVDGDGWIICNQPNDRRPPACTDASGKASRC